MPEPDEQMRAAVEAGMLAAMQDGQSRGVQYYDERMRMVAESAVWKVLTDRDPERLKFAAGAVEAGMKDYLVQHGPSWASAHAAKKRFDEGPKAMAIGCAGILALFVVILLPPILILLVPLLLIYAYKIGDKVSKGG